MKNAEIRMDETNRQIIRALRENCRRSARELALEIGISPSSLIERIKRMEKSGVITGYSANVDFLAIGYEFQGFVHINISEGKTLEVQKEIAKIPGVMGVYDVTGEYDSVALVMCKSRGEFSALIKKILAIPHVEKTNTSVVLTIVKDVSEFSGV